MKAVQRARARLDPARWLHRGRPSSAVAGVDDQPAIPPSDVEGVIETVAPAGPPDAGGVRQLTIAEFGAEFDSGALADVAWDRYAVAPTEVLAALGPDPCSREYAENVLTLWRTLSGRTPYDASEHELFEVLDDYFLTPFPYTTRDPHAIGSYLGAISLVLRHLRCKPPAQIVEMGAGWGHMALQLALAGYQVDAVDINPGQVELLRRRSAASGGPPLTVIESDFLSYRRSGDVDAVVFFESFHHCAEPFALLDSCADMIGDEGQIVFVADAIYDAFYAPWGPRLDGTSLHATRAWGWLELGFSTEFFFDQLRERGFEVSAFKETQLGPYGDLVVATRG